MALAVKSGEVAGSRWPSLIDRAINAGSVATTLLSSEAFQGVKPDELAELVSGFEARIIVYLREHYRSIQSSYCQAVHARTVTESFDDFLESRGPKALLLYDFLGRWQSAFGTSAVVARPYPSISGDLREDFCEAAGIPSFGLVENSRSNPSIGGQLLEFKLALNRLGLGATVAGVYQALGRVASEDNSFRIPPEASVSVRENFIKSVRHDREQLRESAGINLGPVPEYRPPFDGGVDLEASASQICELWQEFDPRSFTQVHDLVNERKSIWQMNSETSTTTVGAAILRVGLPD